MSERWWDDLSQDDRWRMLTTQPHKYEYYDNEMYFRESWHVATEVLGDDAAWLVQRTVPVTIKPEGILTRQVSTCLDFLARNDYLPIHMEHIAYTRHMIRELWRYQLNTSTPDRIKLGDSILCDAQAVVVFCLDLTTPLRIPATSRFVPLKGGGWPEQRNSDQLRSLVRSPNRMLVVVHSPDEPIDVLRELGIMFEQDRLAKIYHLLNLRADSGEAVDMADDLAVLYERSDMRSLSVAAAVSLVTDRLTQASQRGAAQRAAAERARQMLVDARSGRHLPLTPWLSDVSACGVDADSWEVLLVASQYIQHDLPGGVCLVNRSGRQKWAAGEGRIVSRRGDRVL